MRRIATIVLVAAAAVTGAAGTASATECTPKGCTVGGCTGGLHVDPERGTITWEPYVC